MVTVVTRAEAKIPRCTRLCLTLAVVLILSSCQSLTDTTVKPKSAANETVVIGSLRTISSAQSAYSATHDGDYGTFDDLVKAGHLDARFSSDQPVIGGYVLTLKATPKDTSGRPSSYSVSADPQQYSAAGSTGSRYFYFDSTDGVIHVNTRQAASSSDPAL